jgi:thiamine kinase-like enzyme
MELYSVPWPKSVISISQKAFLKDLVELMENKELDQEFIDKAKKYKVTKAVAKMYDRSSKITTIIHGDLWSNNMMFSNDSDGIPGKIKLLDFQMGHVAHPAIDLCYFLYSNTDSAFRKNNLDRCLREYFVVFRKYLTGLEDFGYDEFKKEYDSWLEPGIISGMTVTCSFMTCFVLL